MLIAEILNQFAELFNVLSKPSSSLLLVFIHHLLMINNFSQRKYSAMMQGNTQYHPYRVSHSRYPLLLTEVDNRLQWHLFLSSPAAAAAHFITLLSHDVLATTHVSLQSEFSLAGLTLKRPQFQVKGSVMRGQSTGSLERLFAQGTRETSLGRVR